MIKKTMSFNSALIKAGSSFGRSFTIILPWLIFFHELLLILQVKTTLIKSDVLDSESNSLAP